MHEVLFGTCSTVGWRTKCQTRLNKERRENENAAGDRRQKSNISNIRGSPFAIMTFLHTTISFSLVYSICRARNNIVYYSKFV